MPTTFNEPIDEIEADYYAALARLQEGKPQNKDLMKKLAEGRLKINVSTVAKESGRSRTLLASMDTKYRNARQAVLLSKVGGHAYLPRTAGDTISSLRRQVQQLKAELQQARELNLSYFERWRRAQKKLDKK
jgi:predicted helicase